MKFLLTNIDFNWDEHSYQPFNISKQKNGDYNIYLDKLVQISADDLLLGITDGYLRDVTLGMGSIKDHHLKAYSQIKKNWPLPLNITGSFSSMVVDKITGDVFVCTDLIGLYPLYYFSDGENLIISNSIILFAFFSNFEFDEVGILQRSIGEDFSNIGSRTILQNCKRLLPGEYIMFEKSTGKNIVKFDNSLYQNLSPPNQKHSLHKKYWRDFKTEVNVCLTGNSMVKIALSGGIDSRIILGAVPEHKNVHCLTFGHKENYETKIAKNLAKLKKADFKNFYQPELYFPPVHILKKYTLQTEAVQICSWLEILENVNSANQTPLLLGELCEALPGRNILKFSSRKFRQQNFFKYYLLKKDYVFEKATPPDFQEWKEKVIGRYLLWYADIRLERMEVNISPYELKEEVRKDLEEIFQRIEAHNLPYLELYDELFSWYTYTRMRLSKQLLISNSRFKAYSPAMSMRVLRNTSNIHPNLRLNYRFAKKLFKDIPELKKLNSVPTSQAPLVPQYFPDLIKFPIWGIRSKIDSYLIKKSMKKKKAGSRYRLFKSIDWASVYHLPEMEENLNLYFKRNHLGEKFFHYLVKQARSRKELEHWPFANIDIVNAASLNIEIDIIKDLRKGDKV